MLERQLMTQKKYKQNRKIFPSLHTYKLKGQNETSNVYDIWD